MVGLAGCPGKGTARDYILAYMWFLLAERVSTARSERSMPRILDVVSQQDSTLEVPSRIHMEPAFRVTVRRLGNLNWRVRLQNGDLQTQRNADEYTTRCALRPVLDASAQSGGRATRVRAVPCPRGLPKRVAGQ